MVGRLAELAYAVASGWGLLGHQNSCPDRDSFSSTLLQTCDHKSTETRSGMVFLGAGSSWLDRQDISPHEKRLKLLMTVLDNNSIRLDRKAKL